jgi:inorganic pyrophosphatase
MQRDTHFWTHLDQLAATSQIVIDRPKGSIHPRYPTMIYPLDYGYLDGTTAGDGAGIDVWVGSLGADQEDRPNAILCTIDLWKRDAEIKILIGCTESDIETIVNFTNDGGMMQCMVIRRGE